MVFLPEDMRTRLAAAFQDGKYCVVATASSDGVPDVAHRGSVVVLDGRRLGFWERSRGTTLANLETNPRACVMYADLSARIIWRFIGQARLHQDGPLAERVWAMIPEAERRQDPEHQGVAVELEIEEVREHNRVVMRREA